MYYNKVIGEEVKEEMLCFLRKINIFDGKDIEIPTNELKDYWHDNSYVEKQVYELRDYGQDNKYIVYIGYKYKDKNEIHYLTGTIEKIDNGYISLLTTSEDYKTYLDKFIFEDDKVKRTTFSSGNQINEELFEKSLFINGRSK